jgi:formamidopyrimidine-DNA glycosylase
MWRGFRSRSVGHPVPELPEVETTRRGLTPLLTGKRVGKVEVLDSRLRWPVPKDLSTLLKGRTLRTIDRRAKYLLFRFSHGTLIGHLGMSGSMRVCPPSTALRKHDHVRIGFGRGLEFRYHDPRRFGFLLWTTQPAELHPRLIQLGPEPLGPDFDGSHLASVAAGRKIAVKPFLMDNQVVVGVGNIYANEALFRAGIRPSRAAGRIAAARWDRLAVEVREVLTEAIHDGGTTLRDFLHSDGEPGYFEQNLQVYDREGQPCCKCQGPIRRAVLGQRASYFCPRCQR